MKLIDIVPRDAILTNLTSRERDATIAELVDALVNAGGVEGSMRDELVQRVIAREQVSSTGFGHGVAVPHARHPSLPDIVAAVGVSGSGIDFQSLDRQPVYTVVLLLSPDRDDARDRHLETMEVIFGKLSDERFRRALRNASSPDEVADLLSDNDAGRRIG